MNFISLKNKKVNMAYLGLQILSIHDFKHICSLTTWECNRVLDSVTVNPPWENLSSDWTLVTIISR